MNRYDDVLREINELLSHIEECRREIEVDKDLIREYSKGLDDADGPGLEEYRQSLIEEIRELKDEREWLYDEKDISYIRLRELKAEKAKFENPQWQQKTCKSPDCNNVFWYRVDWQHIPNYCPDCKRRCKKR